jgi:hypothetical protein
MTRTSRPDQGRGLLVTFVLPLWNCSIQQMVIWVPSAFAKFILISYHISAL